MSSHRSAGPGIDQYVSSPVAGLPPPPPRTGDGHRAPDPLRRGNGSRLPALTTNLVPGHSSHISVTPLSTVSLSSPFVQQSQTPYSPVPGSSSRGPSPMAGRGYNVPYNPSEWASGSRRSSQNDTVDPENGMNAPPPPYSPPQNRVGTQLSDNSIISPADTAYSAYSSANPSQVNSPATTAGVLTPGTARDSMIIPDNTAPSIQVPPPPPRGFEARRIASAGRARPVSVSGLSQVITHQPYTHSQLAGPALVTDNVDLQPPAARRAASAGAVSNASSSVHSRDASEASSARHGWHTGVPLPGPPPGPPPAASRSHSASSSIESHSKPASGVARHSQAYRVPLRAPLLSPMPPTPAGWTEDQPMHTMTRPVPLHVQTTNLDNVQVPHRGTSDPAQDPTSQTSSGLTRSTAVRDSSVKGIRERRSLRKSISDPDATTIASLVVDTNPWSASIRNRTLVKSPGQLSDSHIEMEQSRGLNRAMETERPSSSRSASFSRQPAVSISPLQTNHLRSPRSPAMKMHRLQTNNMFGQGGKALPTPPLSQKAPASAQSILPSSNASLPDFDSAAPDSFAAESIDRHKKFLEKESQANTDEERLQIFADYIVAESVLRLKNSSVARQVDLLRIRQRLFDENDPAVVKALQMSRNKGVAAEQQEPNKTRPETMWWKDYQPALSPIASMSNDEMSSRGRASSRWWESQTGGSQGEAGLVRRSKRESKYMGLSTTLINSMIEENNTPTNIPNSAGMLGPDEYPQEKADPQSFGIYDEDRHPSRDSGTVHGSPGLMDISRFITLPPPYPRHHPAVNNSHPQLADYRLTVRSLSDLSEIKNRKSRQQIGTEALRNEHDQKVTEGRKTFRNSIQMQIAEGSITYAEAAEAEAALREDEHRAEKKVLQAEFDTLQDVVINPLHDMLNDRLVQLNASVTELSDKIRLDAQEDNPDRPQQEGDDTPELLEYLTQLKWLFETRETVQKEIFELLTMRNDKYKEIVVLPYRQSGNNDKVRETEAFFTKDNQDRRRAFCDESMQRHQQLYQIVEENVARGIELQSSAFWDIAPNLLDLLQKLSSQGDVDQWNHLQISESEYLENPSYYRFPQQYLYSLLDHAEKSTYQFIEGQVNLHCLLHEVKTSRLLAECRRAEVGGRADHAAGWEEYRKKQESVLTSELKQKVGIIEDQWAEALGSALQGMRERVKGWLEEQGGWEEIEGGD